MTAACHNLAVVDEPLNPRAAKRSMAGEARRSVGAGRAAWFGLEHDAAQRLVAGESAALEQLFDAAFEPLYAFARRMVRDEATAEDVIQEVFVKLLRALPTYRAELPLRPWVFAIASNTLRDLFAARAARQRDATEALDAEGSMNTIEQRSSANPSARIERFERSAQIERAVRRLPPLLRSVIVLRHVQGLAFDEIATILETSDDVVRQRCSRALRELRYLLGSLAPGHEERT